MIFVVLVVLVLCVCLWFYIIVSVCLETCKHQWCSGNINAFQAFALDSISGWCKQKQTFCLLTYIHTYYSHHKPNSFYHAIYHNDSVSPRPITTEYTYNKHNMHTELLSMVVVWWWGLPHIRQSNATYLFCVMVTR